MVVRRIAIAFNRRYGAAVGLACAFTAATTLGALADLKLCNTTASRIGVAIGYQDATGWTTEGWWNIAARTCETLYSGTLSSRFYYVHAIDYDRGGEWAGKSRCAPSTRSFTITRRSGLPAARL